MLAQNQCNSGKYRQVNFTMTSFVQTKFVVGVVRAVQSGITQKLILVSCCSLISLHLDVKVDDTGRSTSDTGGGIGRDLADVGQVF